MSTVASPDTHMFEAKAEVLGWALEQGGPEEPAPMTTLENGRPPSPPSRCSRP